MDERTLFDRFHEALEMEPRTGAYERMRFAMTNRPVALKRQPAFRMRWSKMGLRIAAGLTAVVILIALIAAFVASHRPPVGSVPGGQDPNVKSYQSLMSSDYYAMSASTSSHCGQIEDTGCEAAIKPVVITLQKWVNDLVSFQTTPARYAVIDGQLRHHLSEVIVELNAAVAFQKAKNQRGFDLAMNAAFYERAWIDPVTFAVGGTYSRLAATHHDAIRLAGQSLDGCVGSTPGPGDLPCQALSAHQTCSGTAAGTCESNVQTAETQTQAFLIALLQNPAPSALATEDAQLQADLARADTALLAITDALLSGDSAKVDAAESSYAVAIATAHTDASAIGNG